MKNLVLISFIILSINSFSQSSKLIIYPDLFSNNDNFETPFSIFVLHKNDTIFKKIIYYRNTSNYDSHIELDSLTKGDFTIILSNNKYGNDKIIHSKNITIENDQIARVDLTINEDVYLSESNEVENDTTTLNDIEFKFSYGQDNWFNNTPNFKSNASFDINAFYGTALCKHLGMLGGWGFGFSQYNLKIGNNIADVINLTKQNERYNYLNTNVSFKFRFTSGNQLISNTQNYKIKIDLGAIYYFPFYFKNTIKFEDDLKMVKHNIHNYTDARAFINFGYNNVLLFMEYRIFDFVKSNYIQIPKINAGIKISINPEIY